MKRSRGIRFPQDIRFFKGLFDILLPLLKSPQQEWNQSQSIQCVFGKRLVKVQGRFDQRTLRKPARNVVDEEPRYVATNLPCASPPPNLSIALKEWNWQSVDCLT